ncbi:hypothetical protein DBIPINDM_008126 (plasmid) [Mesorhizobium sp. AR02]|uniref:hypothetical protein n=1 Tax=Mesorhizobium sp. AR02 TaxID=2865837 RepID=UPI00215F1093|nr:hypothetical protein [Mesorhizobium sp. AR02]UVK57537.1 hypothetical protein DBIPINDM_008126 [Mesorhizobium sp. AR02]
MGQNNEPRPHKNEKGQPVEDERNALRSRKQKDADEHPHEKRTVDEDEVHINDWDVVENDVRHWIADILRREGSGVEIGNDAQCQQHHAETDIIDKALAELARKLTGRPDAF